MDAQDTPKTDLSLLINAQDDALLFKATRDRSIHPRRSMWMWKTIKNCLPTKKNILTKRLLKTLLALFSSVRRNLFFTADISVQEHGKLGRRGILILL